MIAVLILDLLALLTVLVCAMDLLRAVDPTQFPGVAVAAFLVSTGALYGIESLLVHWPAAGEENIQRAVFDCGVALYVMYTHRIRVQRHRQ